MRLILVIAVIINAPLVVNAVGQGESCIDPALCDAEFDCIDGTPPAKSCLAKKGTDCANTAECTTNEVLVCGGVSGSEKCLTAITAGTTCTDTTECVAGLVCEDKTGLKCLVQTGDTCVDTDKCGPNLVCGGIPTALVCLTEITAGNTCTATNECVTGLICEDKGGLKCLVQTGETCVDTDKCGPNLVCGGIPTALVCLTEITAGNTCTATNECVTGLVCEDKSGSKCLVQAGDTCVDTDKCGPNLVCGGIPTALVCLTEITAGNTCTATNECVTGLICEDKGGLKCLVQTGETCVDTDNCGPNLVCGGIPTALVCLTEITAGNTCTATNECVTDLVCEDKSGSKCLVQAGDTCVDTDKCGPNLVCGGISTALVCLTEITAGNTCTATNECVSGLVCGGVTTALECVTPITSGNTCTASNECAAGLVCGGLSTALECLTPITSGNTCTASNECAAGLVCGGISTALECLTPITSGNGCTDISQCVAGLICETTGSSTTKTCQDAYQKECTATADCQIGGLVCEKRLDTCTKMECVCGEGNSWVTSKCEPVSVNTKKSIGEACVNTDDKIANAVCTAAVVVCDADHTALGTRLCQPDAHVLIGGTCSATKTMCYEYRPSPTVVYKAGGTDPCGVGATCECPARKKKIGTGCFDKMVDDACSTAADCVATTQTCTNSKCACADTYSSVGGVCIKDGAIVAGETCASTDLCKAGLTCLGCINGGETKCTQLPAETVSDYGASCETKRCVAGLKCTNNVCLLGAAVGQPCKETNECDKSLACAADSSSCKLAVAVGGACSDTEPCGVGLGCGSDSKCTAAAPVNGECDPEPCASGQICTGSPKKCVYAAFEGASCATDPCAVGLTCVSDVCKKQSSENGPCATEDDCATSLKCIDKKCSKNSAMTSAPAVFAMVISVLLSLYGKDVL